MATETIDKVQVEVEATAKGTSAVFQQLGNQLKTLQRALGAIDTSKLQKATDIKMPQVSPKVDTSGLSKAERQIDSSLSKIRDRITSIQPLFEAALKGDSSSATSFGRKAMSIEGDIDVLRSRLEELKDVKLPTAEFTTLDNNIGKTQTTLENLVAKEQEMKNSGVSQDSSEWINLQTQIGNAKDELNGFISQQQQMVAEGTDSYNPFKNYGVALDGLENKLGIARVAIAGLQDKANEGGSEKFAGIKAGLDAIMHKASGAAIALAKLTGSGIIKGFRGIANAVSSIKKRLSEASDSGLGKFKKGFMTVLKYGLGIRSLYVLFRRLKEAIKDSFAQLQTSGAFFETTKANIEGLKNALLTLKYQFGAAFEPIFNVIAPALQTLINYLVSAMNALSAFFAKVTGKSTYSKVKSVTAAVAGNTGAAAKNAKELNKQLQGFDELNNLTSNSGGGGGGGAGGGGGESAMYEEANVDDALGDFGKRLAEAIKKGDWKAVGSIISQKLTEVMEDIPWNKIFKKAENFGKNLANFLNGLITPELFSALGKTIGNAIKTKLTFLNSFGETFDWKNFGNSIAAGINGFVSTNPLKLAAKTINTWSKGILDALITAVDNVSWKTIAKHIADFLADLDLKGIGTRLGKLVNSIANAIYDLVSNKDTWINLGTKIADGINGFVSTTDWGKVAFTLSALVSGLISAVSNLVQKTNWDAVGSAVVEMIAGIDWEKLLGNSVVLLGAIIKGLLSLFLGIGSKLSEKLAKAFESVGADTLAGFFKGISDNIKESTKWVKEKFDIFIKAVKDFFGIHSPSTVFAKIGANCIDGLKKGFTTAISKLKSWIKTNITGKIVGFFSGVKDIVVDVKGKVDSSFEKAKEAWESVKTKTETLIAEAKEKVKGALNTLQSKWNDWKPALKELWTSAKEKAKETIEGIKTTWNNWKDTTKELWTSTKQKVGETIEGVKSIWDTWTGKDQTEKTLTTKVEGVSNIKDAKTEWDKIPKEGIATKKLAGKWDSASWKEVGKKWKTIEDKNATVTLESKGLDSITNAYNNLTNKDISIGFSDSFTVPFKAAWNGVAGAVNQAINEINKNFKKNIPAAPTLAKGGSYYGNAWHNIPQYANGTLDALKHGTIFAAGEAGPEVVGHINGRTEVLNRSQIASTVFQAITNGMKQFKNAQMVQPPQLAYASGSVASYDGITQGNNEAMIAEQNRLLAEQNRLLQYIAQKEISISSTDVFNATRSEANSFYNRTGNSPFLY